MDNKLKFSEQLKAFGWSFKQAWRMNKTILLVWGFLGLAFSILPAVMLGLNRNVVRIITDFLSSGAGTFSDIVWPVCVLGIVLIGVNLTARFNSDFLVEIMYDSYCVGMQEMMMDQVQKVSLKSFLNKEFNDGYTYVGTKYFALVEFISKVFDVFSKLFCVVSLLIVAFSASIILFWFSLAFTAAFLLISYLTSKPRPNEWEQVRDFSRVADYYSDLVMSPNTSKEARIFELDEHIVNQHTKAFNIARGHINKRAGRISKYQFALSLILYVFIIGAVLYSIYSVSKAKIGPDQFLLVYSLCTGFYTAVNSIGMCMSYLSQDIYELSKIKNFIETSERFASEAKDSEDYKDTDVVFGAKDLSFGYNEEKLVLKKINLKIHKGDIVALVGLNGSGKTTLTQLMLALYPATSGELLLYGKPVAEYSMKFLRTHIGVFFQNIVLFHLTLRENVGFGDISSIEDREKIWEAIKKGGAFNLANKLEGGLDALLLKDVDKTGNNLSGGEQQKVAVSRTHMNDKEILIFDEPASMLDPIAEMEQFFNIKEKLNNRTAVLISHRVGFARLANKILVLKDGQLIENGTHDDLIANDGEYAKFFRMQSEWYQQANGGAGG